MQNKISVVLFEFWSHISSSSTPVCALLWLHSIFQYLYCSHPLECGMLLMMTWTLIEPHSYIFTENAHMIFVFPSFKQVEKISWFLFPFIRIQKRPWKTVFVSWLEASDVRKSSEGRKFPFNSSSSTVECALQEMQRLNSKGWKWRKASSDQSRESESIILDFMPKEPNIFESTDFSSFFNTEVYIFCEKERRSVSDSANEKYNLLLYFLILLEL